MDIYTLMEIKDKICDMKTYHNFCVAFNIPFKTNNQKFIQFNDCENILNYSYEFVEFFIPNLNWEIISEQILTETFLNKFQNNILWFYIFKNHKNYNIEFLKFHKNKVNMQFLSMCELTDEFIRNFFYDIFSDYTKDYYIFNNLSLELLKEFESEIDWDIVSKFQIPKTQFLLEFKNSINWYILCRNHNLSMEQIKIFQDYVDWNYISEQNVYNNIKFIEQFKTKLNWYKVSRYFNLNSNTIEKFNKYLIWPEVSNFQNLDYYLISKFENKIDWSRFSANIFSIRKNLGNKCFIDKYKDKIKWKIVDILI